MSSEEWQPDPSWPPDVQQFITGLRLYLHTLSPEEQKRLIQDVAVTMMTTATEERCPHGTVETDEVRCRDCNRERASRGD